MPGRRSGPNTCECLPSSASRLHWFLIKSRSLLEGSGAQELSHDVGKSICGCVDAQGQKPSLNPVTTDSTNSWFGWDCSSEVRRLEFISDCTLNRCGFCWMVIHAGPLNSSGRGRGKGSSLSVKYAARLLFGFLSSLNPKPRMKLGSLFGVSESVPRASSSSCASLSLSPPSSRPTNLAAAFQNGAEIVQLAAGSAGSDSHPSCVVGE